MTYTIPAIPPSNNKYICRNAQWAYQEEKKRWQQPIAVHCRPKPREPIKKAAVRLTYYFKTRTRRDPDNYSGKFILDGLVRCGIIEDDCFGKVRLELEGRYDKDEPRTVIEVTEVEDG